eukprot:scaffold2176_cov350-Prasinococcus_capsulatus_cf.AAC.12
MSGTAHSGERTNGMRRPYVPVVRATESSRIYVPVSTGIYLEARSPRRSATTTVNVDTSSNHECMAGITNARPLQTSRPFDALTISNG